MISYSIGSIHASSVSTVSRRTMRQVLWNLNSLRGVLRYRYLFEGIKAMFFSGKISESTFHRGVVGNILCHEEPVAGFFHAGRRRCSWPPAQRITACRYSIRCRVRTSDRSAMRMSFPEILGIRAALATGELTSQKTSSSSAAGVYKTTTIGRPKPI